MYAFMSLIVNINKQLEKGKFYFRQIDTQLYKEKDGHHIQILAYNHLKMHKKSKKKIINNASENKKP